MPGVYRVDGVRAANVYVLDLDDGLVLIDSGMRGAAGKIAAQVQSPGRGPSGMRAIVLTHGHMDHMGSAADLARLSGAAVMAHRADVPYIERTAALPLASRRQRILGWLMDRPPVRPLPCRVDRPLDEGDVVAGLRVIHTPGHTPGSMCLYDAERRLLFCGDALLASRPQSSGRLRPAAPLFSGDLAQARESLRKLAGLPVETICFGHGPPVVRDGGAQLAALLARLA